MDLDYVRERERGVAWTGGSECAHPPVDDRRGCARARTLRGY